jgi:glycosyltransferase involved in cell wall biosynthesis
LQNITIKTKDPLANYKKIGIVLNTAWNIHNFRLGLIRALIQEGYKVVAIAPEDEFVSSVTETGAQFVPLQHLSRKGVNPFKDWMLYRELYQIFKQHQLDAVLLYTIKPNIYGNWAAKKLGIPSIATVTGLGYSFMQEGIVHQVVKLLYRSAFRKAKRVAFQNSDDKALFEELSLCVPNQTMLIKGSGINTSYFQPMPKAKAETDFVFLFVGRLLYDKGVRELLQAAEKLQAARENTTFWIVGGIDEGNPSAIQKDLLDYYEQQGAIKYLGQSSDVRSIMREADVVVLPSYREGLPRVMLESLAMGKPIITTDAAGCRETIRDGENGFCIPVRDDRALFEALVKMRDLSAEQRQAMGAVGRTMALEEFDEQIIVGHYLKELAVLL